MKSDQKLDGWRQHQLDQLRHWMSATPAQRLAALEEMREVVRSVAARRGLSKTSERG